jgi:choline dehydrogenase
LQFLLRSLEEHSTDAAFLLRILQRLNLTTTGALVPRLLFEGIRTVGADTLKRKTIKLPFNSTNLSGLNWALAEA